MDLSCREPRTPDFRASSHSMHQQSVCSPRKPGKGAALSTTGHGLGGLCPPLSPCAAWPHPAYSRTGRLGPALQLRKCTQVQQRRSAMKVKEAMHRGVDWVSPDTPVTELAKLMREHDIGAIPIGENDR